MKELGLTEQSYRHIEIVSKRVGEILEKLGFDQKTIELGKIAGYLHDIGNCVIDSIRLFSNIYGKNNDE